MEHESDLNFPGAATVDFGGETFVLLPGRALWWPRLQTLVVADVHLGKGAAFRKLGVPVPAGGSMKDLGRIATLAQRTGASRIIVLGDLVHARASYQPELREAMLAWREKHSDVNLLLVRGNHDRTAGRLAGELNIEEAEEPVGCGGILLSHVPRYDLGRPVLAGHVHPVVSVRDFDRSRVRLPCFVLDEDCCATLPSFGSFTGGHPVGAKPGRRIYLAAETSVVKY
jgi:DNA ligase-associated metallophosphoesterase